MVEVACAVFAEPLPLARSLSLSLSLSLPSAVKGCGNQIEAAPLVG